MLLLMPNSLFEIQILLKLTPNIYSENYSDGF